MEQKVLIQDWFEDSQSQQQVHLTVEDVLHSNLPDSYDWVAFKRVYDVVYDKVFDYSRQGIK